MEVLGQSLPPPPRSPSTGTAIATAPLRALRGRSRAVRVPGTRDRESAEQGHAGFLAMTEGCSGRPERYAPERGGANPGGVYTGDVSDGSQAVSSKGSAAVKAPTKRCPVLTTKFRQDDLDAFIEARLSAT